MLWSPTKQYRPAPYNLEADVEQAILEVRQALFGSSRIYLDVRGLRTRHHRSCARADLIR